MAQTSPHTAGHRERQRHVHYRPIVSCLTLRYFIRDFDFKLLGRCRLLHVYRDHQFLTTAVRSNAVVIDCKIDPVGNTENNHRPRADATGSIVVHCNLTPR